VSAAPAPAIPCTGYERHERIGVRGPNYLKACSRNELQQPAQVVPSIVLSMTVVETSSRVGSDEQVPTIPDNPVELIECHGLTLPGWKVLQDIIADYEVECSFTKWQRKN